MSCERYKPWIEDAAAEAPVEKLDRRQQSELHSHLESCAACRALLERERALAAAIDSTVIASVNGEPSPYFAARVRARIAEGPQRSAGFIQWLPLAAGAMAVVAAIGIWLWRANSPSGTHIATQPPDSVAPAPVQRAAASAANSAGNRVASVPRHHAGPQVLVAPGEKAGFRSLYEFARAQRIAAEALPNVAELRKPLDTPELKIKPMEIAALDLLPPVPPVETPVTPPGQR